MKTSLRRSVGRGSFAAALAALLPLAFAVPVHATTDAVDQSLLLAWPRSYQSMVTEMAQTFTAGVTGQLDKVSLQSDAAGGFLGVVVRLEKVGSSGLPDDTHVLGTATNPMSYTCCKQFHDFSFQPTIPITTGTRYAIVVVVWGGTFTWYDSGPSNLYPLGRQYIGLPWMTTGHWDFGFQDWYVTSVNSAPAVTAASNAVSVTEGAAPTNTGTYSDGDGDTVKLSPSSGTVTQTGTSNGTWSWTQAASDEAPTQTVVITADDGQGLTTTTSFTLNVTPVAPTAQILSAPLSSPEGAAMPFTGGATSPDPADNAAGFTYAWSVTNNGAVYSTGSGSGFTFTPQDEGTFVVTLMATDDGGMSGTASATVSGTDITPTARVDSIAPTDPMLRSPLVILPQESLSFAGSFTDPAPQDTHSATWNFGDGATAAGFSVGHSYALAGTYTITLSVSDDDGTTGQTTTTVLVQTPQQSLGQMITYIQGLSSLNGGQRNSLIAKLNAASDAVARGDTKTANNELNAFINELEADHNNSKISDAAFGTLLADAHAVQGALGTYNRFLEWWPLEA